MTKPSKTQGQDIKNFKDALEEVQQESCTMIMTRMLPGGDERELKLEGVNEIEPTSIPNVEGARKLLEKVKEEENMEELVTYLAAPHSERKERPPCDCGCCHAKDYGPCPVFEEGTTGRCVFCDHGKDCHPGKLNGPHNIMREDFKVFREIAKKGDAHE